MNKQLRQFVMAGLVSLLTTVPLTGNTCTSVGMAGSYLQAGGTLIGKNRDAPIQGYQRLSVFRPKGKFAYLAMTYGNDESASTYPYIAAGTNEKGLTVLVNDPASHYPTGQNEDQIETTTVRNVLENYATVADVRKDAAALFGENRPALFIVGDASEVANFEAGYQDRFAEQVTDNGRVWALNEYHLPLTEQDNRVITADVKARYETLSAWLEQHTDNVRTGDVLRLLASTYHGEFNSISREVTVSQYVVVTPPDAAPLLLAKFTIPTQPYNEYRIELSEKFFSETPAGPLDDSTYGLLGSINMKKFDQFIESIEHAKPGSTNTF